MDPVVLVWLIYFIYAFVQAILVQRYILEQNEVVMMVTIMMVTAPITSVCVFCWSFSKIVTWLTTYKSKKKTSF